VPNPQNCNLPHFSNQPPIDCVVAESLRRIAHNIYFTMPSVTLIRHTLLPFESIQLGRLVRNVDEPQSDYLDPDLAIRPEPIVKPYLRYQEAQQNKADSSFIVLLTSLASASRIRRNKSYTQVATDRVTTYQLDNSGSWFKAAIQTKETREWIQESIDQGDDVYLVVGYLRLDP
jgi:hypothetical protein